MTVFGAFPQIDMVIANPAGFYLGAELDFTILCQVYVSVAAMFPLVEPLHFQFEIIT